MERKSFWSERIAFFLVGALSVAIMALASSYGIGSPAHPGPGMYPFVVGLLIFPLSLILFVLTIRGEKQESPLVTLSQAGTLALFLGTCAFWILAMPLLGYPLVTLIATFALSKIMRLDGWLRPLLLAGGTALFITLLFDVWLYIDLPRGIWG